LIADLDRFVVGHRERLVVHITAELVDRFAALSGDVNPLHVDHNFAATQGYPARVAHGVLTLSFVSTLIGTALPGRGALWRSLKVSWLRPVFPEDTVTLEAEVTSRSEVHATLFLALRGVNQNGQPVLRGDAVVGVGGASTSMNELAAPAPATPSVTPGARAVDASERPVLVTGASGGIGRAAALQAARLGHPVAIGYRTGTASAETIVAEIEALGGQAILVACDFDDPEGPSRAVDSVRSRWGRCLGLVHCASPALITAPWTEIKSADVEIYFRVYVTAALALVQAMRPDFEQHRWGRCIFLGTAAQLGPPPPQMLAYVTAKSAVEGLTKALAAELGVLGVTVNMILPGLTMTELTRHVPQRVQLLEAQRTPLRRLAAADDTAAVVAFLLGDGASFMTGAKLPVTGGLTML
jgi:3-oxoacyl-[acyl-carrier protein] reductase